MRNLYFFILSALLPETLLPYGIDDANHISYKDWREGRVSLRLHE